MSRAVLVLSSPAIRAKAHDWIDRLPENTRIEFKEPKRTLPQSALMWVLLGEIAEQVKYHGLTLSPDDFKLIFLDALKREVRIVPNTDGTGFVNLGRSSSDLSKEEMSMMLELLFMYGAQNGVVFSQPKPKGFDDLEARTQ